MSRPSSPLGGPAADARAGLPESDTAAFDRLAHAVLASASAPLGPLLRAQLPGTAGVQWLRHEGLAPTTRPTALTSAQWRSLFDCWTRTSRAPRPGAPASGRGGRPSTHGHAPGAAAIPRWGQ